MIILVLHGLINIFGHRIIDVLQNVSVWWHVAGAAVVVAILVFVPDNHQSFQFVFTERFNNSGFGDGDIGGLTFWFYVLPLGFLLTQYTITGFDACAHVSEETRGASQAAARGLWQSIFYSAVGGWILLLAFLFAATDVEAVNAAGGFSGAIFESALTPVFFKIVIIISTIGQFFCGMSCVTSMSRMAYAFSRDRAVPGWRLWSKVDRNGTPVNAIIGATLAGLVLTLPALYESSAGIPIAFYAVVSVAVLGLYLSFLIPIALRLRMGDRFVPGPWTLGPQVQAARLDRGDRDRGHRGLLRAADRARRGARQRRVHLVGGQLRAARRRRGAAGGRRLVVRLGPHWFTGPVRTVEEPAAGSEPAAVDGPE